MANKKTIMTKVAKKNNLTTEESRKIVNDVLDAMWESILEDKILSIYGFGSFNLSIRNARAVKNPSSKELMQIPDKLQLTFDLALPKRDALYDRKSQKPTDLGQKLMDDIRVVDKEKMLHVVPGESPKKANSKQLDLMKERLKKNPIKEEWLEETISTKTKKEQVKKPERYSE